MMTEYEFRKALYRGITSARNDDLDRLIENRGNRVSLDTLIQMFAYNVSCFRCDFYDQCHLEDSTVKNCERHLLKIAKEIEKHG